MKPVTSDLQLHISTSITKHNTIGALASAGDLSSPLEFLLFIPSGLQSILKPIPMNRHFQKKNSIPKLVSLQRDHSFSLHFKFIQICFYSTIFLHLNSKLNPHKWMLSQKKHNSKFCFPCSWIRVISPGPFLTSPLPPLHLAKIKCFLSTPHVHLNPTSTINLIHQAIS